MARSDAETIPGDNTVLVVDDQPDTLGLLHDTLEKAGYTVLVARDGESALKRLSHRLPDAILLDAMMPGLSGFDTCRQIKAQSEWRHIPVLFMTGLSDTDHVLEGFDAGGVDYVVKPIREAEVLARLKTHIETAREVAQAHSAIDLAGRAARRVARAELTPRETEVLSWVAKGKSNREIAEILGISPRTVNKHLEHTFPKLGVETRAAAAVLIGHGLQS